MSKPHAPHMNTIARDQEFWELADAHIAVANQHMDRAKPSKINAAFLFSAARFAAFLASASSDNKAQFMLEKEAAIGYFVQEFETYLRENFDEHLKRYAD